MKKIIILISLIGAMFIGMGSLKAQTEAKPRVMAMTDGEVDDRSSMVRFLLYTNDIDLVAIIQTSSVYQTKGWSSDKWIEKEIDAYEQVYPNLIVHDPSYPSATELRKKLFVGDEDSTHVIVDRQSALRVPGIKPVIDPANWKDTPGSDKIVETLLENDPRSVHIQAWGGGNTAARAFYKLKTQYPSEYKRAVSKVVMYNIWYQDGAGYYIERNFPEVTMLLCHYFINSWAYGSQRYTNQFVHDFLHNDHGALGALYPQSYISEGDSPSFLYSLPVGLRSTENPAWGGWGGMFSKVEGFNNVYRDYDPGSYTRWIELANRDFEARLDWCVKDKYTNANHKPIIQLKAGLNMTVKAGETVKVEAEISDKDTLNAKDIWNEVSALMSQQGVTYEKFTENIAKMPKFYTLWWQYKEAGSYNGVVEIANPSQSSLTFVAPQVKEPATIHMIIQATDNGKPALTAFARVIITALPIK